MNKIIFLSTYFFLIFNLAVKAQTPPNAFNYSAVARNAAGQPIASTTIGIQITILKTSSTGATQYSENHFVNTDAFGLFNLIIGTGTIQSGSMESIDWSSDDYYLKVDMDASGGTNFLTMGTTQLLSVPYALYAKSAGTLNGNVTGGLFTHYIGEPFGEGVIFHLWKDTAGVEHGLIVDKTDLGTSEPWSNILQILIGPSAQSNWDGLSNSNNIINQPGHTNSAAALCLNSTNGGQSDWYLPSIDELSLLWHNRFNVNKTLAALEGASTLPFSATYWSSTEFDNDFAWYFTFYNGYSNNFYKGTFGFVRAIRAF